MAAAGRGDAAATFATAATIAFALVIPAVWGGLLGARLFLVFGLAQLGIRRYTVRRGAGRSGSQAATRPP